MPCPVDIPINFAARMKFLLQRSSYRSFINEKWKENMEKINDCQECGQCRDNCPYELDTPNLLKEMLADYMTVYNKIKG